MTFEERIDRITERHEALAQSVELFLMTTRENAAHMEAMIRQSEALIRQNEGQIRQNTDSIGKLVEVSSALLRTAESHERRISSIEQGRV